MIELLNSPLFGIMISIGAYEIGLLLYRRYKLPIFNPLLISASLLMVLLSVFKIDIGYYNKGGNLISFFLGPATVILAVPLYRQIEHLKSSIIPIMSGIILGCITAVTGTWVLAKLFKLAPELSLSLLPKSVTTPIGIELSKQIGGIPSITVAAIIVTGIIGAVLGPLICKVFRITDSVAVGIAIGTSSHALGTTKAVEIGETEGAMSGLAIGVAGLVTVVILSFFTRLI